MVGRGTGDLGDACGESVGETAGADEPPAAAVAAAVGVESDGPGCEALPVGLNGDGILLVLSLLALG